MKEVEENGIWKVHEMITLVGTEWEQFSHTEWDWGKSGLARRAKEREPGEIYSHTVAGCCHFLPVLLLPPCGLPGNLWRSFLCCYDLFSRLSSKTLTWKHLIHFVKSKNSTWPVLALAWHLDEQSYFFPTEDQPPTRYALCSQRPELSLGVPFWMGTFSPTSSPGDIFSLSPPSPSFLFFVFFSSPYTGLSHGSSVVLGMLRCLLTPPKWTSSVIIFGFLAALSSFLGSSFFFFFSMDGGDRGTGGRGRGQHSYTLRVTRKTDTHQAITNRLWRRINH